MTLTERIERMAAKLNISAEDFKLFSAVKCLEDLEYLDRVVADPDLRRQAAELVALRKLGKLDDAELAGMLLELFEVVDPEDAGSWTP